MSYFKIIAVDGIDCSGKEHITKLLTQKLQQDKDISSKYEHIERVEFPTYECTELVDTLLDKNNQEYISEFFANEWITKTAAFIHDQCAKLLDLYIKNHKYNSCLYILDRYYMSNIWYNLFSHCYNEDPKDVLENILNIYSLPIPDVYFYIKMPEEFIKLFLSQKKNKDYNELNLDYLIRVKQIADKVHSPKYKYEKGYQFGLEQYTINCTEKTESKLVDTDEVEFEYDVNNLSIPKFKPALKITESLRSYSDIVNEIIDLSKDTLIS